MNQQPNKRFNFLYFGIIALVLIILIVTLSKMPDAPAMTYSEVLQQFDAENVKSFQWKDGVLKLELHHEPESEREELKGATTVIHEMSEADKDKFREEHYEQYDEQRRSGIIESYNFYPVKATPWYLAILPYALVRGGLIFLMYFLFNRAGGAGQAPKFSRAAIRIGTGKNKVTFADVKE